MVDRLFGPVETEKVHVSVRVQNGSCDMMQCKKGIKKTVTSMLFYCAEASLVGLAVLPLRRLIINKGQGIVAGRMVYRNIGGFPL